MSRLDLTGKKFDRLTVLEFAGVKNGNGMYLCLCDCGNETIVQYGSLTSRATRSCGCLARELSTKHGLSSHKLYSTHNNMMARCYNKNAFGYKDYGGRGITVCPKWHDVHNYIIDIESLGPKPSPRYTLDRINNELGYFLKNMRWATIKEQNSNQQAKTNTSEKYITKHNDSFCVRVKINGKQKRFGSYGSLTEAIKVRDKVLEELC